MADVTRILDAIERKDPAAAAQLLPLVYDELRKLAARKMAQEQPGLTLQATALVHEAYVTLVGQGREQQWDHRGHFFAAAATGAAKTGTYLWRLAEKKLTFATVNSATDSRSTILMSGDWTMKE